MTATEARCARAPIASRGLARHESERAPSRSRVSAVLVEPTATGELVPLDPLIPRRREPMAMKHLLTGSLTLLGLLASARAAHAQAFQFAPSQIPQGNPFNNSYSEN